MDQEKVIVIDFGGQYNQLVARRVRECNVYCEIYSYKTDLAQIKAMNPKGIILTGGPTAVMKMARQHVLRTFRTWCTCTWSLLWRTAYAACAWWQG